MDIFFLGQVCDDNVANVIWVIHADWGRETSKFEKGIDCSHITSNCDGSEREFTHYAAIFLQGLQVTSGKVGIF